MKTKTFRTFVVILLASTFEFLANFKIVATFQILENLESDRVFDENWKDNILKDYPRILDYTNCTVCDDNLNPSTPTEEYKKLLNTSEILERDGFQVTEIRISSYDGYDLLLYRIGSNSGHPVVIHHGMLSSSHDHVLQHQRTHLPGILHDRGFDVYLMNMRGTKYSSGHHHPEFGFSDRRYWKYSIDDIIENDMRPVVDKVRGLSGYRKIIWIGYSIGTDLMFGALARFSDFNRKIQVFIALAPCMYLNHMESPLKRVAPLYRTEVKIMRIFDRGALLPNYLQRVIKRFVPQECDPHTPDGIKLCVDIFNFLTGDSGCQVNTGVVPLSTQELPQQASAFQWGHIMQMIFGRHQFCYYDYGYFGNYERYHMPEPPCYQPENIKAPVVLMYGDRDSLIVPEDVLKAGKAIGSKPFLVPILGFNHLSFVYGKCAPALYWNIADMAELFARSNDKRPMPINNFK